MCPCEINTYFVGNDKNVNTYESQFNYSNKKLKLLIGQQQLLLIGLYKTPFHF